MLTLINPVALPLYVAGTFFVIMYLIGGSSSPASSSIFLGPSTRLIDNPDKPPHFTLKARWRIVMTFACTLLLSGWCGCWFHISSRPSVYLQRGIEHYPIGDR